MIRSPLLRLTACSAKWFFINCPKFEPDCNLQTTLTKVSVLISQAVWNVGQSISVNPNFNHPFLRISTVVRAIGAAGAVFKWKDKTFGHTDQNWNIFWYQWQTASFSSTFFIEILTYKQHRLKIFTPAGRSHSLPFHFLLSNPSKSPRKHSKPNNFPSAAGRLK